MGNEPKSSRKSPSGVIENERNTLNTVQHPPKYEDSAALPNLLGALLGPPDLSPDPLREDLFMFWGSCWNPQAPQKQNKIGALLTSVFEQSSESLVNVLGLELESFRE